MMEWPQEFEMTVLQALSRCDGATYGWPPVRELAQRKGIRRPLTLLRKLRDEVNVDAAGLLHEFLLSHLTLSQENVGGFYSNKLRINAGVPP